MIWVLPTLTAGDSTYIFFRIYQVLLFGSSITQRFQIVHVSLDIPSFLLIKFLCRSDTACYFRPLSTFPGSGNCAGFASVLRKRTHICDDYSQNPNIHSKEEER